jgi:hypothetical protein
MALQSSGQISLNDVRIEASQSIAENYSLYESLLGLYLWTDASVNIYAPINVNGTNILEKKGYPGYEGGINDYSMSVWYGYNHTAYTNTNDTSSLYPITLDCYSKTMAIIDAGTTNRTIDINVSGSVSTVGTLEIFYGKPWKNNAARYSSSLSTLITSSYIDTLVYTKQYDYTYDSNVGQYLYVVFTTGCN